MENRIKSYIKTKDKNNNKEKDEYKILRVTQSLKGKKEKEKEKNKDTEKEKKDNKNNKKIHKHLKTNKSMAGILSDSETIKTETTRGDTLTENSKVRYVYRKNINRKNCFFATKNYLPSKNHKNENFEKKNRLNYSMSLNKFLKENYDSDNVLSTNHNFYRRQSHLLNNNRTNNIYNDKFNQFYERGTNISYLYERK